MATFRVGVGSFNINDGSVGIGTEGSGHGNLKVEGTIKSKSIDVLGVSTFTRYSGFSADNVNINNRDLTLSGEYSTTGDVVVEDGASLKVGVGSTACIGTVESVSVKNHFSVPAGDTNQRNESTGYSEGVIRFNSDLNNMEFFNGNEWRQFTYTTRSGRGLVSSGDGGSPTANQVSIDLININTLGNAVYFGDITEARTNANGCSNGTRGVFAGGYQAPTTEMDTIDYVTIAAGGNAIDFGNLSIAKNSAGSASSSTRGLWMGGTLAPTNGAGNTIDYIEIATLGDALDFGDLSTTRRFFHAVSSSTRAITAGGHNPTMTGLLEFVIIASKGNAVRFGELTQVRRGTATATSFVRGVISNGSSPTYLNTIDYITMASEGNAINFGDSTQKRENRTGVTNTTRGVFAGGLNPGITPTRTNIMDFVIIASTGDAQDFGDLTVSRRASGGASDSHGGLGGY